MTWIIVAVIVGIVLNFIVFSMDVSDNPTGAMGAAPILLLCFVPYLIVGVMLLQKVIDLFEEMKK